MSHNRSSLKPMKGANRSLRQRLDLKGEFTLALAPTMFGLAVGITAALVLMERLALWVLSRYGDR